MWDQVLQQINHATTPRQAVLLWGGDPNSLVLVSQAINVVYRFTQGNRFCYLRLTHAQLRKPAELAAAIAFQQHLVDQQVAVCTNILSCHGHWIEAISQEELTFLAHVCAEVPGTPISFDHANPTLYHQWGKILAQLHQASTQYRAGQHDYGSWQRLLTELEGYAQHEPSNIQQTLAEVSAYLTTLPCTPKNYGLIHGDHRKGNVLTDGQQIHIIDFDLPQYSWFIEDISRPFFSSIVDGHQNWQDKIIPYLKGYQAIRSLTAWELEAIPWFLRYKALDMYLWTQYNWQSDTVPWGGNTQQWLNRILHLLTDRQWNKELCTILIPILD